MLCTAARWRHCHQRGRRQEVVMVTLLVLLLQLSTVLYRCAWGDVWHVVGRKWSLLLSKRNSTEQNAQLWELIILGVLEDYWLLQTMPYTKGRYLCYLLKPLVCGKVWRNQQQLSNSSTWSGLFKEIFSHDRIFGLINWYLLFSGNGTTSNTFRLKKKDGS